MRIPMKRTLSAGLVLVVALVGCGGNEADSLDSSSPDSSPSEPPLFLPDMFGEFHLEGSGGTEILYRGTGLDAEYLDPCTGGGGYEDIRKGTQVVVRDGEGSTLATSKLGSGGITKDVGLNEYRCTFHFKVKDLEESEFYAVEVSHRDEVTYTLEELKKANWEVTLTL